MNNQVFRNNIIRRHLDYSSRSHINCIRFDGNGDDKQRHENKLIEVCLFMRKKRIDFICRSIIELPKGKKLIPDILVFTQPKPTVIEILNTEKIFHAQSKNYPSDFKVIPVHVNDDLEGFWYE